MRQEVTGFPWRDDKFNEDRVSNYMEQADKFLRDGMTLETTWKVYGGVKKILTMVRQKRLSKACVYRCAEMKIRMEQRLGAIIQLMESNHPSAVRFGPATVRSLRIRSRNVAVWKQLAEISEDRLAGYFSIIEQCRDRLTTAEVLREREAWTVVRLKPSMIFGRTTMT